MSFFYAIDQALVRAVFWCLLQVWILSNWGALIIIVGVALSCAAHGTYVTWRNRDQLAGRQVDDRTHLAEGGCPGADHHAGVDLGARLRAHPVVRQLGAWPGRVKAVLTRR